MSRILTLLCVLCSVLASHAQTTLSRVTFPLDEHQSISDLAKAGLDVTHGHSNRRDAFTTEVQDFQFKRLDALGIRYTIDIPDMNEYRKRPHAAHRENPLECQERFYDQNIPRNFELGSAGGFFTMSEVIDQLDVMAFLYPHLVSVRRPIGNFKTWENNNIFWVRLSDNPEVDEEEPEILYTSLHHAREPISVSQSLYYMWYLVENYDKDPVVRQILDNTELYFVPVVNPDGMQYNLAGYDPVNDRFTRNHRKNMRDNNLDGIFDPEIDGVDLNRNYGHAWGHDDEGSSGYAGSDTYRGPAPFSEPETQAIQYLCEQHDFRIALNHHAYGNLLIHPWGYNNSSTPDSMVFSHYGDLMTQLNRFQYGRGMETVGYITNGDSDDWMYTDQNIFSMTPEVGDSDDGFYPARDRIIPLCQSTLRMNLLAAQLVSSLVTITDANPDFIEPGTNPLSLEFTRFGLVEGDLEVSFQSLSPHITQMPAPFSLSLDQFIPVGRSMSFQVSQSLPYGQAVQIEILCQQGEYIFRDTLTKYRADVETVIQNPGVISAWDTSKGLNWNATTEAFKSGPVSITDSPLGPYAANSNQACMLAEVIDLTEATDAYVQYWAKWDIEDYYDYVVFQASSDGHNWDNLCGRLSRPGSLFQLYEEPLYDGRQSTWALEHVDLADYLGKNILLRFAIVTDGFVHQDGFYFDDFKVVTVRQETVSTDPVAAADIAVFPNPASDGFTIRSSEDQPYEVTVFNALGRVVYQQPEIVSRNRFVATDAWPAGLYHYLLRTGGQVIHSGPVQVIR